MRSNINRLSDQLTELAEIKYAELCGMHSDGNETARLQMGSRQIAAVVWAVGLVLGDYLDELGLEIDALWAAVDPDNDR